MQDKTPVAALRPRRSRVMKLLVYVKCPQCSTKGTAQTRRHTFTWRCKCGQETPFSFLSYAGVG